MIKDNLKKQALELSKKERAKLAHLLIDSLNPDTSFDSREEWSEELKRRINQYQQDEGSTKPWHQVKNKAYDLLDK